MEEGIVETPVPTSEILSQRVHRTIDDLAVIRQSLLKSNAPANSANPDCDPMLDLELAAELKSLLDTLREHLWSYIVTLSAKPGCCPQDVLKRYKMELAVDLLRNANTLAVGSEALEADGFSTFGDLVNAALSVTAIHAGQEPLCKTQ